MIGRYERVKTAPSIDVPKKLASLLNTSIGYLLRETDDDELFKGPGRGKEAEGHKRILRPGKEPGILYHRRGDKGDQ
jgi:transcriptional regulator with XRE-family HTH domain